MKKNEPTETPTPKTDAHLEARRISPGPSLWASAEFARTLEKELSAATAQLEEARRDKDRLDWCDKHNPYKWANTYMGESYRSKVDAAMQQKEGK